MRTLSVVGGIMVLLLCLPRMMPAQGEWFEYFDTYANGSGIDGQGGWELWPVTGGNGYVRDYYSYSSPHSLEIAGASDVVHQYSNYTSGKWLYRTWIYIPNDFSGQSYFIMLSNFNEPDSTTWAVQVSFRALDGTVRCDCGNSLSVIGPEYVTGQWMPLWVFIDLDEDWTQVYYNGILLDSELVPDNPTYGGGYPWTGGVSGGEHNNASIAAVDLFANGATPVYYDDIMLLDGNTSRFDLRVSTTPRVRFEYDIYPGSDWGLGSDVWLVAFTPQGIMSYTGSGPLLGWESGISPMATGPLGIHFGVPLDVPGLPPSYWGDYTIHLAVDTVPNGVPDTGSIWNWVQQSFTYP